MRSRLAGDVLLRLIEQAYAAAERPQLWERFLQSLSESVNGRGAALLQHDLVARGAINVGVRLDPNGASVYNSHYNRLDPWAAGARALGPGVVATDEMLVARDKRRQTEYFADFAVRYDAARLMTVILEQRDAATSVLTVLRSERDGPFESADRRFVAALVPHVQQSLQIHRRIVDAQRERATALDALDAVPCAVFLVNPDARVVLTNSRGRAMLMENDGLSTDRSRLSAADPRETKRIRELCAAVAAPASDFQRHPGGVLTISRCSPERPPLQAVVAPTPSADPFGLADERVTGLVFVSDPTEERAPSEPLMRHLYGLTAAEAAVAARIAVGRTLAEIADERGSALETVRRQSKQILAKTGARHRSELVRMLSALPQLARVGSGP